MDGHSADDAHSVSAVAVIDLSDGAGADPHGLLTSSVVVIGGEDNDNDASTSGGDGDGLLQEDNTADEEEEEDDDDDEDAGGGGCGPDCGHDHAPPVHMTHIGSAASLHRQYGVNGGGAHHRHAPHSPTPSSTASATTGGGSTSTNGKRKRVVLSIHEKQQVLHRLEHGEQPVVISRDFGISRQQVSDIKKNKERILAFCIDAKHLASLKRKTLKATTEYHPGVEQELYRWLIRQRKLDRGVTAESLSHKTTDLFMQYAADDAANVSFRSIHVWLRHFKRAHKIKNMTVDELAKLPDQFTPAMDMAGASNVADGSSVNGDSVGHISPQLTAAGQDAAAAGVVGIDDVSSYMSSMVLPQAAASHAHQYLLQNHAPSVDAATPQSFQMLMLSAGTSSAGSGSATSASASAAANAASASVLSSTSLQSCAHLAQTLTLQLSLFEREIANKLDSLDSRVEKLCFSVLSTSAAHHPTTRFA